MGLKIVGGKKQEINFKPIKQKKWKKEVKNCSLLNIQIKKGFIEENY